MWLKICGITTLGDAELAVGAGADAIGLNFVSGSPRAVGAEAARQIIGKFAGKLEIIGVVADLSLERARALVNELGLDALQLHGDESADYVRELLPCAYKAVRIGDERDVALAREMPGERLLIDAKVAGALGGTGARVDLGLVKELCQARRVILAGGLTPDNVAGAIREALPFGVDVASGVEARPGVKDPDALRNFIASVRRARP